MQTLKTCHTETGVYFAVGFTARCGLKVKTPLYTSSRSEWYKHAKWQRSRLTDQELLVLKDSSEPR